MRAARWSVLLITFALSGSMSFGAQQPMGGGVAQSPEAVIPPQAASSIVGMIRDEHGNPVAGITVALSAANSAPIRTTTTDAQGNFRFAGLAPGTYRVTFNAVGLEPSVPAELVLGAGERHEVSMVALRIPIKKTTVRVVATLNDVAQAQVKQQEQQRVLGILPDYYTSYIWDAVPMTPKLKLRLGVLSVIDPVAFLVAGGVAGIEQKHNTFPGYGQEAEGYAKRYGSTYADTVINRMLGEVALPTVLHQDPRYFYRGSGSVGSRILYALAQTVVCRGDNGHVQPNYSHLIGNFATAGLSNLYKAPGDRQAGLTLRNGLIITGNGAVQNLLREFLSRKLTPKVPAFAKGKPEEPGTAHH